MKPLHFHWLDYVSDPQQGFYMNDLVLRSGESIPFHDHDYYELYVVRHGSFEEVRRGQRQTVPRGGGCLLRPEDAHCLAGSGSEVNLLRNLAVRRDVFEGIARRLQAEPSALGGFFRLSDAALSVFGQKTEEALRRVHQPALWAFALESVVADVLLTVAAGSAVNDRPRWLSDLVRRMEREENYIAGLPRMTELCGKTPATLCRAFRRYYDLTPTEYINILRLSHGAFLLQSTNLPVIQVALTCGFNNISYFNRLFRRRYQQSPLQYRKKTSFFY